MEPDLYELIHAPSRVVVARRIVRARGFFAQGMGLLARRNMEPDEGLWLEGVGCIHTLGMRISLDILFLDQRFGTLGWISHVPPNRPFQGCKGARSTIELAAGTLDPLRNLAIGDTWLLQAPLER